MSSNDLSEHLDDLDIIWNALVRQDNIPRHVDVIVVGGECDLGLAEKAAELYHQGLSESIIISGYQPAFMEMTEAKFLADRCIELAVPKEAITLEEKAGNTGQNITFSATLASSTESVILIHKPYMSLRFLATAEAQWPEPQPKFYVTCQDISFGEYVQMHGLHQVAFRMIGDMKRMTDYVKAGYQTQQPISDEAQHAYQRIITAGFVSR